MNSRVILVMTSLLVYVTSQEVVDVSDESLNHKLIINDNYHLYWAYDNKTITFEVRGRTQGWIGLGFSPNGAMTGADIYLGWVKNDGNIVLYDMHGEGNYAPILDDHQDAEVVGGREENGWTVVRFRRKLQTCDNQDMGIGEDTLKVIWAYGSTDPVEGQRITGASYHGSNRGVRSVTISTGNQERITEEISEANGYSKLEFKTDNFSPPVLKTYYNCKSFKLPEFDGKKHMIKVEPIVQAGNELNVHHMILHSCGMNLKSYGLGEDHECYMYENFVDFMTCQAVFHAWAVGGEEFYYPSEAGYPLGTDGSPQFLLLETHYDNPNMQPFEDSSGFRIWLTEDLRKYDAEFLQVGNVVSEFQLIPPNTERYSTFADCSKDCLKYGMDTSSIDELNVFAILQHSHTIGKTIELKHIRDGVELKPINVDRTYDFNYQEIKHLDPYVKVKKGDSFRLQCNYSSIGRSKFTQGGLGTEEEMCISYVIYYPKIPVQKCMSSFKKPGFVDYFNFNASINPLAFLNLSRSFVNDGDSWMSFQDYLDQARWSDEDIRGIERAEQNSEREYQCFANYFILPDASVNYTSHTMEEIKTPYITPDLCTKKGSSSIVRSSGYVLITFFSISFLLFDLTSMQL